jgi:hypothetical protein
LRALVDHKTVVLVLGVTALAGLRGLWDLSRAPLPTLAARLRAALGAVDPRAVALGAGFTLATFAWWAYGFVVDAPGFVRDHLRMHIAHRILLNDVRLAHDADRYAPSIPELWGELGRHTGTVFLVVAAVGIALWLFTRGRDDRRAVLAAWCVCGSVLFSLTDWRQSKHLMNEVAPMVAAAVCLAWPLSERGRARGGSAAPSRVRAQPGAAIHSADAPRRGSHSWWARPPARGDRRPRHRPCALPADRRASRARLPLAARPRASDIDGW